jgi:hypothetical protein
MTQRVLAAICFAAILTPSILFCQRTQSAKAEGVIGRENAEIAQRVGVWDVTESVWDSPAAIPVITKWVAERKMIGEFLEEILEPATGAPPGEIQRIDYLSYHRIEGRWKYVSMDTRASVGMMPATSADRGDTASIHLTFEPFAVPIKGSKAGQLLMMQETITKTDANHDRKDQYFNLADGSGTLWLKHRYEYSRRQSK